MDASQPNIFVARQPIFKRNKEVFAYELLFRSGLTNYFDPLQDGEEATSKVITNSFLLIGIPAITEGKKAFINFSEDMLLKGYPSLFPKEIAVVEVLETVGATPEVVQACEALVGEGYVLALDDFLYEDRFLPLIKLAKIIKFDIRQMSLAELEHQAKIVSRYNVKLLAEKIETNEEFEATKKLGFELFQGYFFSRPHIMEGRDIPGSKLHYLQVLKVIQDEDYDFAELAKYVSRDVSLAYKLLKYANSAYFARRQKVESIEMAVAMLGQLTLRKWLSLMMLSYLADDKPSELLRLAAFRGSFCELIADQLLGQRKEAGMFHTVGMFSLLPAMLDKAMADILPELALPEAIQEALLVEVATPLSRTLRLVMAYERGDWENTARLAKKLAIKLDSLPLLYEQAIEIAQAQLTD
ncbi:MAG: HDOD domain-containing protein [Proteobacteria bacterium]|nr:HDOD domain-containing protein [Pseudomonadota bacterium]MBU4407343.1 HDOD domain-containing protein [Pseudomonadota bacterium]MBU4412234.1 HDOD domain-containing protein [Pseudomonadota bacterium]MCG2824572.1 HDOD domain-containing protein [Desulfobulbaceae bacterium]